MPMRAIRADATGDITPKDPNQTNGVVVWAQARKGNYMQTPIVVGDLLFGCLDNGAVTCFEAKTGAIKYSQRLAAGGQGFSASPVSDARHVYFTSEEGQVFVLPAEATFSVTATNSLGETCMATPALSDGCLFFRTRDKLIAVGTAR